MQEELEINQISPKLKLKKEYVLLIQSTNGKDWLEDESFESKDLLQEYLKEETKDAGLINQKMKIEIHYFWEEV